MKSPNNSILNSRLNVPTIIATIIAAIPAAFAAQGSAFFTKTLGYIANYIDVGISDIAHSVVYNLVFPFIFGMMNIERYSPNGKFEVSKLLNDLIFKMVPAAWVTAAFLFHLPRNIIQYQLIKANYEPWVSSLIADGIMLVVYLPIRNLALKILEWGIEMYKNIRFVK